MWILTGRQLQADAYCARQTTSSPPEGVVRCAPPPLRTIPHLDTRPLHGRNGFCEPFYGACCLARRRTAFPPIGALASAGAAPERDGGSISSDPRAARLKAWVLEHSRSLPTQLTPVQRSDGAYSLVTDEPVRRGQTLIRVPRKLLLSIETARASEWCGRTVREAGLNEWQALLLHLLCERAAGRRSFWWPYLETLPQDMSYHPLLWGPERLAWLAGSPLRGSLERRQAQVAADCEVLLVAGAGELPLAEEFRRDTGTELVSPASVGWAAAVLLSRSFSLDLAEEEPLEGDMGYFGTWTGHGADVLALVPWADGLQHCSMAGPESVARYQCELGVVTLTAHRDYGVGEPAQDSHGPHLSPVDLFMDYGLEEPPPPAMSTSSSARASSLTSPSWTLSQSLLRPLSDAQRGSEPTGSIEEGATAAAGGSGGGRGVEVAEEEAGEPQSGYGSWQRHRFDAEPADVARPRSSRNAALLSALTVVQGEGVALALGEGGPDSASLTYVRAALASDAELVRAGWRVKATERDVEAACRAMGALAAPSSPATEAALLAALADYVAATLAAFPSSLELDLARLAGRDGLERISGPERLAVVALASQKIALHGTARAVAAWRAKLTAGCPVEELYDDEYGDEDWGEGEEEEG